jgi:hypothetical protein
MGARRFKCFLESERNVCDNQQLELNPKTEEAPAFPAMRCASAFPDLRKPKPSIRAEVFD